MKHILFTLIILTFSFNLSAMDLDEAKQCSLPANQGFADWYGPEQEKALNGDISAEYLLVEKLLGVLNQEKVMKKLPSINNCAELGVYMVTEQGKMLSIIESIENFKKN